MLSCPGDTLQEHIDFIGMSNEELAARLGYSVIELNRIINGEVNITSELATKLENVLDVPASLWLNLERRYQANLSEIDQLELENSMNSDISDNSIYKL